ncbi:MAG: NUDIX domain-containing protein, partial [Fusobacteria bacterium]|nr:NUDIX domain-containing protein [Fusobacteriota bacterium]
MNIEFETDHFLAAIVICIVIIGEKEYLLFQKRSEHIEQPGDISFPGGHFEKEDITLEQTALREFREEIGEFNLELVEALKWHVTLIGAIIEPWVGKITISDESKLSFSHSEVSKLILLPLEELIQKGLVNYEYEIEVKKMSLLTDGSNSSIEKSIHRMRNRVWKHQGYAYELPSGEVVWGITGE